MSRPHFQASKRRQPFAQTLYLRVGPVACEKRFAELAI